MVLKVRHFGKQIRNAWKVLKGGAGEELRSFGAIMRKMKQYCAESRRKGMSYIQ
jgi:hypothetical protein